jgi:hypothetical protein
VSLALFAPVTGNDSFPAMLMVGGEKHISDNVRFITENWLISHVGVVTGGVRVSGKHIAADFALGLFVDPGERIWPFPVVNVMWKF